MGMRKEERAVLKSGNKENLVKTLTCRSAWLRKQTAKTEQPHDPAAPILDIYPKEKKNQYLKEI